MIYHSNLSAPDLQPYFNRVRCAPMAHSCGHDVLTDLDFSTGCGFATHDEAALLFEIASANRGRWLDIGGYVGWTAAHMAEAGCKVTSIDPDYRRPDFRARAEENLASCGAHVDLFAGTSDEFFAKNGAVFAGVMIDGNHDAPYPERDAINASRVTNLILFHDAYGQPIRDGIRWLVRDGWNQKPYWTPHLMVVCWTGSSFHPPEHTPDERIRQLYSPIYDI